MAPTNTPPPAAVKRLEALVYYAVDKASPYSLAYSISTDSLSKIGGFKLAELAITPQGASIMWLWINAYCQPDAKPTPADVAAKCKTVDDVRKAVMANVA
ncbi:hypothetical protein [Hydrogenophaga flava]|uniref:hypothetical protein n=1 Tax=Hydrogenophaga flava TaxID=65657 RepID=UPI0008243A4B|nr:hypothetical protein [Hydrogenophaga flava]